VLAAARIRAYPASLPSCPVNIFSRRRGGSGCSGPVQSRQVRCTETDAQTRATGYGRFSFLQRSGRDLGIEHLHDHGRRKNNRAEYSAPADPTTGAQNATLRERRLRAKIPLNPRCCLHLQRATPSVANKEQGKGLCALTLAAFSLGLEQTCRNLDLPAIGIVMLDSPLVTFREAEADEAGLERWREAGAQASLLPGLGGPRPDRPGDCCRE
jgi:hypothetical protein